MKCSHPDCSAEPDRHPVISFAFEDPAKPRAQVHLLMPLCAEHAQHDPANVITDGAFESLCAMVAERGIAKPVRESITVSFAPYALAMPGGNEDPLAGLFRVQ